MKAEDRIITNNKGKISLQKMLNIPLKDQICEITQNYGSSIFINF